MILRILRGPGEWLYLEHLSVSIATGGFLHLNPVCGEATEIEKTSPDRRYVAVLMTRDCGATRSYVAPINLRPVESKFGTDFFDGTIKDGEVFTSSKYEGNRFCWSKPHKLSLGYPDLLMRNWRDVTIDDDFRNPECQ